MRLPLRHARGTGACGTIRTSTDDALRVGPLPLGYAGLVRPERVELSTFVLKVRRSTTELRARSNQESGFRKGMANGQRMPQHLHPPAVSFK